MLRLTHGRGVDHVIEVGGAGTLGRSIGRSRPADAWQLIGVLTGPAQPAVRMALLGKQASVQASSWAHAATSSA